MSHFRVERWAHYASVGMETAACGILSKKLVLSISYCFSVVQNVTTVGRQLLVPCCNSTACDHWNRGEIIFKIVF
jgi:hypothetical protein